LDSAHDNRALASALLEKRPAVMTATEVIVTRFPRAISLFDESFGLLMNIAARIFSRVPERAIGGGTMLIVERPVVEWIERVRAEYLEMPGLSLTRWQMRRLWLLDATVCDAVVDALVAADFLRRRPNDTYVRRESRR